MSKYLFILVLVFVESVFADINGKVVAVTDGDTIKVLDSNNVQYKVRLTGIDAPEKAQPFGNASRKNLASMVAGKDIHDESSKNDHYGRVLGKVWVQPSDCRNCGKTLSANHAQTLSGRAWWYSTMLKTSHQKTEDAMNPLRMKQGKGSWAFGVKQTLSRLGSFVGKVLKKPLKQAATSREISALMEIGFTTYLARPGIAVQKSANQRVSVGFVVKQRRKPQDGERLVTKRVSEVTGECGLN